VVAAIVLVIAGALLRLVGMAASPIPPGGDAYHHVVISELIMAAGGLPESFVPFASIASFSYHFGLHSYAALVGLAAGIPALQAVVATAVLLNAVIALSVFALARVAGIGGAGALVACLIVALVSPSPVQLLDLARYPQTAALVILPALVAIGLTGPSGSTPGESRSQSGLTSPPVRMILGGALLVAGLFLTHYRIALFGALILTLAGIWAMAEVLYLSVRRARKVTSVLGSEGASIWGTGSHQLLASTPLRQVRVARWRDPADQVRGGTAQSIAILLIGLGAGLLVLPWMLRLRQTFTMGIRGSEGQYGPAYYDIARLGDVPLQPATLLLVAVGLVGLGLGFAFRNRVLMLLTVWAALQLLASNPSWLRLPFTGQVDTITVLTTLFLPLSLGIGFLVDRATGSRQVRWRHVSRAAVALVVAIGVGWGALQITAAVHPERGIADARDVAAAAWIARELPASARFLVNASIQGWNPDFVVPTDGGYWLPLLAGRPTTLLPMLYPAERGVDPSQIARMEELAVAVQRDPGDDVAQALLCAAGVTHVYLGVGGGPIDERKLMASPRFRSIYRRDGVAIYELVERSCP
jgi:hypothetical protein